MLLLGEISCRSLDSEDLIKALASLPEAQRSRLVHTALSSGFYTEGTLLTTLLAGERALLEDFVRRTGLDLDSAPLDLRTVLPESLGPEVETASLLVDKAVGSGCDVFGSRLGSVCAEINKHLTITPKRKTQLAREAGLKSAALVSHLEKIAELTGYITADSNDWGKAWMLTQAGVEALSRHQSEGGDRSNKGSKYSTVVLEGSNFYALVEAKRFVTLRKRHPDASWWFSLKDSFNKPLVLLDNEGFEGGRILGAINPLRIRNSARPNPPAVKSTWALTNRRVAYVKR